MSGDSGDCRRRFLLLSLLISITQTACKPEAYNSSSEGVESLSTTAATNSATTVTTEDSPSPAASPAASPSPSPSPSASSGYTVTLTPTFSTQILGACGPISVGFVDANGTAISAPIASTITLTGGSSSEFYDNTTCVSSQSNTVTFTKLDSAKSIYHRATTAGTLTISGTASVSTVSVTTSSSISISAGGWSSANLMSPGNTYNTATANIIYVPENSSFVAAVCKADGSTDNMYGATPTLDSGFSFGLIEQTSGGTDSSIPAQMQTSGGLTSILWFQTDSNGNRAPAIAYHDRTNSFYGGAFVGTGTTATADISSTLLSLTQTLVTFIRDGIVQVARSTDAGFTWGSSTETIASGSSYAAATRTIGFADGTALAVYKVVGATIDIKASVYSGSAWGAGATVNAAGNDAFAPVLTKSTASETALLVWVQDISGRKDLLATFYDSDTKTFGSITAIDDMSVDVLGSEATPPIVASDPDGNFYVIYTPNDRSDLFIKKFDRTTATWGTQTSLISTAGQIGSIDLKSDNTGNIHVVFAQADSGGHLHTLYRKYVKNLGWDSAPVTLDMTSNNTNASSTNVAITPTGEVMAVYVQPDTGGIFQGYYNVFR